MYEQIVFPTDGSETSVQAAKTAYKQAELFDAKLHIIHIVQYREPLMMTDAHMGMAVEKKDVEEAGEKVIQRAVDFGEEYDVTPTTEIKTGVSPHTAICEYAEEVDADLIIMGTHGWSGAKRVLLGSTTERLIRMTDLPVLTVQVGDKSTQE